LTWNAVGRERDRRRERERGDRMGGERMAQSLDESQ
jgi:hypothetical protein